ESGCSVGAVVDAVRAVHIQRPRLLEHRPVATGLPSEGVRGRIFGALVRLDLRDPHPHLLAINRRDQERSQKQRCCLPWWPGQNVEQIGTHAPLSSAPNVLAVAISVCLTEAISSAVMVRSGARNRYRIAMAFLPAPAPVNTSNTRADSSSDPAAPVVASRRVPAGRSESTR